MKSPDPTRNSSGASPSPPPLLPGNPNAPLLLPLSGRPHQIRRHRRPSRRRQLHQDLRPRLLCRAWRPPQPRRPRRLLRSCPLLAFYAPAAVPLPGNLLAAAAAGSISIYDADPFVLLKTLAVHKRGVSDVGVHCSGRIVLTVGRDTDLAMVNLVWGRRSFCCWLDEEKELVRYEGGGERFFMSGDKMVSVHCSEDAKVVQEMVAERRVLCISSGQAQNWIRSDLRDFSISRSSVEWGIPVPKDNKQTIYVWFDALLGYISALLEEGEQPSLQKASSSGWPASLHLIGKDILRFHAVYWPAMLMSAGISLPNRIFGHGFLTKDGMKMGKSLGNTLEPKDLVHKFGSNAVRYFFLREVEFGNDGDYSEERFINVVNAHLANTIGNLLNRTLGLLKKNCQSTLAVDSTIAAEGIVFKDTTEKLVEKARLHFENLSLSSACECVLEIGNAGNLYIDEHAPWSLFKKGGTSSEIAAKDLVIVLEAMRIIAVALSPVTPSLCLRIYKQLGFSEDQFVAVTWNDTKWGGLKAGQQMAEPKPVFARIEIMKEGEDVAAPKAVKDKNKIPRKQGFVEA